MIEKFLKLNFSTNPPKKYAEDGRSQDKDKDRKQNDDDMNRRRIGPGLMMRMYLINNDLDVHSYFEFTTIIITERSDHGFFIFYF